MSCRKFESWIEDETSGALGPRESALLAAHVAVCAGCGARRAASAALSRDLGALRRAIPELDVVARVMEAVGAEARTRELRVGARAFWGSMAASFTCVSLLAGLAARTARALPAEGIPPADPLLRIAFGCWTTMRAMLSVLATLTGGLLDAALHVVRQSPYALPMAEAALLAVLATAMMAAALPLARILRPTAPGRQNRIACYLALALLCSLPEALLAGQTQPRSPKRPSPPAPAAAPGEKAPPDDGFLDQDSGSAERRIKGELRLNLVSDLTIDEGEVHDDDLIAVGGDVVIDGEVRGDVVVLNGTLEINGRVKGDVLAIMTDTTLGDHARISGEVVHMGGEYEASDSAKIGGESFHTDLSRLPFGKAADEAIDGFGRVIYITRLLLFAILFWGMLIVVSVVPQRVTAAGEALGTLWGHALMVGLLAYAAYFVLMCIFVILSLILIGIPLVALLMAAWFVTKAMGLASILWLLGDRILRNVLKRETHTVVAFLAGFAVYLPTQVIPFHCGFMLMLLALLGWALSTCLTVLGVGLILTTQFGIGMAVERKQITPATP